MGKWPRRQQRGGAVRTRGQEARLSERELRALRRAEAAERREAELRAAARRAMRVVVEEEEEEASAGAPSPAAHTPPAPDAPPDIFHEEFTETGPLICDRGFDPEQLNIIADAAAKVHDDPHFGVTLSNRPLRERLLETLRNGSEENGNIIGRNQAPFGADHEESRFPDGEVMVEAYEPQEWYDEEGTRKRNPQLSRGSMEEVLRLLWGRLNEKCGAVFSVNDFDGPQGQRLPQVNLDTFEEVERPIFNQYVSSVGRSAIKGFFRDWAVFMNAASANNAGRFFADPSSMKFARSVPGKAVTALLPRSVFGGANFQFMGHYDINDNGLQTPAVANATEAPYAFAAAANAAEPTLTEEGDVMASPAEFARKFIQHAFGLPPEQIPNYFKVLGRGFFIALIHYTVCRIYSVWLVYSRAGTIKEGKRIKKYKDGKVVSTSPSKFALDVNVAAYFEGCHYDSQAMDGENHFYMVKRQHDPLRLEAGAEKLLPDGRTLVFQGENCHVTNLLFIRHWLVDFYRQLAQPYYGSGGTPQHAHYKGMAQRFTDGGDFIPSKSNNIILGQVGQVISYLPRANYNERFHFAAIKVHSLPPGLGYMPLPAELSLWKKHGILNFGTPPGAVDCFLHAVAACLNPAPYQKKPHSSYHADLVSDFVVSPGDLPMQVSNIGKFERNNKVGVNVFILNKSVVKRLGMLAKKRLEKHPALAAQAEASLGQGQLQGQAEQSQEEHDQGDAQHDHGADANAVSPDPHAAEDDSNKQTEDYLGCSFDASDLEALFRDIDAELLSQDGAGVTEGQETHHHRKDKTHAEDGEPSNLGLLVHIVRPTRLQCNKDGCEGKRLTCGHVKYVNLLLLFDEEAGGPGHYCAIPHLSWTLAVTEDKQHPHLCMFCLRTFLEKKSLERHLSMGCVTNAESAIVMPCEEDKLTFDCDKWRGRVRLVIYCDFECIVSTEALAELQSLQARGTTATAVHRAVAFALLPVFEGVAGDLILESHADEESCMTAFFEALKLIQKRTWAARPYDKQEQAVVYFHNGSHYDFHKILMHIGKLHAKKVQLIPQSTEVFMQISTYQFIFRDTARFQLASLEKLIETATEKYTDWKVFDFLKGVIDASPLRDVFRQVCRKGIFPYEWFDSTAKYEVGELPPREAFFSSLRGKSVSEDEYAFALRVWDMCGCEDFLDYLKVYLFMDVIGLAAVYENTRSIMFANFHLDCAKFVSAPGFAQAAMLRSAKECQTCHASVEVGDVCSCGQHADEDTVEFLKIDRIYDYDMYLFVSAGMRGGICQGGVSRVVEANNEMCPNGMNEDEPRSVILSYDVNGLYAWAMCQSLPYKEFVFIDPTSFDMEGYLASKPDGRNSYGFLFEVDLDYPSELHDLHRDLPLAPERMIIEDEMLTDWQREQIERFGGRGAKTTKLVCTLNDKKNYIVHGEVLAFYVDAGMVLRKVHRVLRFKQAPIMRSFVEFNNAQRRRPGISTAESDLFKLMNNSVFGKQLENELKRRSASVVQSVEEAERACASPLVTDFTILSENVVVLMQRKSFVTLKAQKAIGVSILDLSKLLYYRSLFAFRSAFLRAGADTKLLRIYGDTDSHFFYAQCTWEQEQRALLEVGPQWLDTSSFPPGHIFHSNVNRKVNGKLKDELACGWMTGTSSAVKMVVVGPKTYALVAQDPPEGEKGKDKLSAKGVQKSYIENNLEFDVMRRAVVHFDHEEDTQEAAEGRHEAVFYRIQSVNHELRSVRVQKDAFKNFDDKVRTDDGINCYPHGYAGQ